MHGKGTAGFFLGAGKAASALGPLAKFHSVCKAEPASLGQLLHAERVRVRAKGSKQVRSGSAGSLGLVELVLEGTNYGRTKDSGNIQKRAEQVAVPSLPFAAVGHAADSVPRAHLGMSKFVQQGDEHGFGLQVAV